MIDDDSVSRKQLRDKWMQKIKASEKKFADYYALVNDIRKYYRNDMQANKHNIFWASVETLKPFLYKENPALDAGFSVAYSDELVKALQLG